MAGTVNDALLKAADDGSLCCVKAALKAGADVNFDQPLSGTALYLAANMGHVDVVRLLLHNGASMKRNGETKLSPLHGAAMHGNTEVVEVLVHHGATVDIRDGLQMTPIMHACYHGHVDTVRRLIEFGARVDLVDRMDRSTLMFCNKEDCTNLIQEALDKKQLRCCNPKCGKPGYRKSQSQNESSTLKLCGGCKLTRYCSRGCQKHHWLVGHKKCCGHDEYSGPVPHLVYAMASMVIQAMREAS